MKRMFAVIVSFLLLLSLCSCGKPATQGEASTASTVSELQEEAPSESEQPRPDAEETILSRSKISKTLSSGVVIDAEVTGLNKESLAAYTGAMRIFSVDEVAAALGLSPKEALSSQTDYSLDNLIPGDRIYLEFEDSKRLISDMNRFSYITDTFLTVRDILITDGSDNNTDLFLTGKDLDFATIEQAQAEIHKVLEQLKIPVVNEPLCYTLDLESTSAENERQYALALEEAKDFNQEMFAPEKLTITEDEVCYLFYYPVAVDGMPVSRYMNGVYGDGSLIPGTELVVCYGKDGIVGLTLGYQPEILETTEAKPVLSLEEILEVVEAKYDSLILDGEYLIYDIRLEYIAKPVFGKENTYTLVPVWRFAMEHSFDLYKGDETGGSSHRFIDIEYNLFDAITGEELPIDLG